MFNILSEFFQTFKRAKGQQFTAYDTAFRSQIQRLEECGTVLEGTVKAYFFLEKAFTDLVVTSATLVVTGALLVVTKSY